MYYAFTDKLFLQREAGSKIVQSPENFRGFRVSNLTHANRLVVHEEIVSWVPKTRNTLKKFGKPWL